MMTTSRFGSVDSVRMLPATLSAGENLVAEGLGVAESTDACRRDRSAVERLNVSARSEQHDRPAIRRGQLCDLVTGRGLRPRPAIAESHAMAGVEENPTSRAFAPPVGTLLESSSGRASKNDHRERRHSHHQQQPVLDLRRHRLIRDAPHEHSATESE